jgi:hypothetical protein
MAETIRKLYQRLGLRSLAAVPDRIGQRYAALGQRQENGRGTPVLQCGVPAQKTIELVAARLGAEGSQASSGG